MNKSIIHAVVGIFGTLIIVTFLSATLIAELFLTHDAVIFVKYTIAHYGIYFLVVFMALTGMSGNVLAKGYKGGLVSAKRKRMAVIAFNGLLIMIPSALFLSHKAMNNAFDMYFCSVQVVEILVGCLQLYLMSKNFGAGMKLVKKIHNNTLNIN